MRTWHRWRLSAGSVLVWLIVMTGTAWSATRTWNGNVSSNWSDSNNWSGVTVPTTGDTVVVGSSANNLCALGGATQILTTISVGNTDPTTYGKLIVRSGGVITNPVATIGGGINYYGYLEVQSNASFCSGSNYINLTGNGMVNVNGGTLVGPVAGGSTFATGTVTVGYGNRPNTGTMNVANGGYMIGHRVYVGLNGIGVMNISNTGTRVECNYELSIGCASSNGQAEGTVNLTGGTLSVPG